MQTSDPAPSSSASFAAPPVGVVVLAHGCCASSFLDAAKAMVGGERLHDVVALDAGVGITPLLRDTLCETLKRSDLGRGVLLLTDVNGSSPCTFSRQVAADFHAHVVAGVSLPMLLKVAFTDRRALSVQQLAACCVEAGKKAIGEF